MLTSKEKGRESARQKLTQLEREVVAALEECGCEEVGEEEFFCGMFTPVELQRAFNCIQSIRMNEITLQDGDHIEFLITYAFE